MPVLDRLCQFVHSNTFEEARSRYRYQLRLLVDSSPGGLGTSMLCNASLSVGCSVRGGVHGFNRRVAKSDKLCTLQVHSVGTIGKEVDAMVRFQASEDLQCICNV